ncbi:MAG: DUF2079 domain-containing protein [Polyangiaceae bacterium]|nr:DUF2079 domain-containing protein [Polyangiaceae bacterium]
MSSIDPPPKPNLPADPAMEGSVEPPVDAPVESPIEVPVESPVESPIDVPVESPIDVQVESLAGQTPGDLVAPAAFAPMGENFTVPQAAAPLPVLPYTEVPSGEVPSAALPTAEAVQLPPPPASKVPFRERLAKVGGFFKGLFGRVESAVISTVEHGLSWFPWPVSIGLSLGVSAWAFTHKNFWADFFENKVALRDRLFGLIWLGSGIVLATLVFTVIHLVTRRRSGLDFAGTLAKWGPRFAFLFAVPFVATMLAPEMHKAASALSLLFCGLAAISVLWSGYAWTRQPPEIEAEPAPQPTGGVGRWLAAVWVGLLWLGHAGLFSYFAIVQHFSLSTRTIDLGYYDNIFYQSIHGRWLDCSFLKTGNHASAHFDPILVLLSPLYLIYPRAELLLVLQSVWIGSGIIPVYLIAQRRLGSRWQAGILGLCYLLHPALQGANLYEFHSLSLLAPLFLWLINFLEKGSRWGYAIALLLVLLCREDAALLSSFLGLSAILAPSALTAEEDRLNVSAEEREKGEKLRRRLGVITIFASVAYFVVVKLVFMKSPDILNSGKEAYSFAYYYEALIPAGSGMGGLLLSLVGNPVFVIKHVFTEPKLVYFATIFLPVLFIPFATRAARWVLAYGLIFCLLASRTAVFSTHFQYATLLYPSAIAFAPVALASIRKKPMGFWGGIHMKRLAVGLVPAILAASVLVSWQFGAIVPNGKFKAGFVGLRRVLTAEDKEQYAWVKSATAQIPRDAKVSVTDKLGAHVSNRRFAFFYPARTDVDFVFIDEGDLKGKDQDKHKSIMGKGTFKEVTRRGKMVLYKKNK